MYKKFLTVFVSIYLLFSISVQAFAQRLAWSQAGPVAGMTCTQFDEPDDENTWNDNYLCAPIDIRACVTRPTKQRIHVPV